MSTSNFADFSQLYNSFVKSAEYLIYYIPENLSKYGSPKVTSSFYVKHETAEKVTDTNQ